MFKYMDDSQRSACFLNEQSRMAEDICRIVSNVFYKSELIVAKECKQDPEWKKKRSCAYIDPIGDNKVCVLSIKAEGQWSHRFHGPIRYESAELIRELVYNLLIDVDEGDIIVLTPFRAQRSLIKSFLKNADLKKVAVSTVHGAQGSEQHTVIFDPVMGKNPFLQTEEAERLINVALSRSQARLILVLSEGDRTNSLLDQIAVVIENPLPTNVIPIEHLASRSDFPDCAKAKVVQIKNIIGKIIEVIDGGKSFVLHDSNTGKKRTYKTSLVKEKFGKNKI
jgi:hypothetical protein